MADSQFAGILNAEHLLRRPSSQEALNFDEQHPVGSPRLSFVAPPVDQDREPSPWLWIRRLWKRHVYITTSHEFCRDHFANERTALGYMRSAQAFAMLGVVIAQLLRLQHSSAPDPRLGFFVLSIPLSCICHIMALLTACLGCYRFFHWQSTMARGQATSGGFVITCLFALTFMFLICIFVLVVVISVRRDG